MPTLSLAEFYDKFEWDSTSSVFELQRNDEYSGMGSLQVLHAQMSSPLWGGELSTNPFYHEDGEEFSALVEELSQPGYIFETCNPFRESNKNDPDGSFSNPLYTTERWDDREEWRNSIGWRVAPPANPFAISSISGDNQTIGVSGTPSNTYMSVGDMVSFEYLSPARRAFHRIKRVLPNGNVMLVPHIRPGLVTGTTILLHRPFMLAKIVPGSLRKAPFSERMTQFTFKFIQVLR